eukprot:m.56740 g.56740  ORF g.56740 m.56740 type:complete len:64 (-) comp11572_c0_seq1:54-245(-)
MLRCETTSPMPHSCTTSQIPSLTVTQSHTNMHTATSRIPPLLFAPRSIIYPLAHFPTRFFSTA